MFQPIIKRGWYIRNKEIYDLIEQTVGEPVFPIVFRVNNGFNSLSFTKVKSKEVISLATNMDDIITLIKKGKSHKFEKLSETEKVIWNQIFLIIREKLKLNQGS